MQGFIFPDARQNTPISKVPTVHRECSPRSIKKLYGKTANQSFHCVPIMAHGERSRRTVITRPFSRRTGGEKQPTEMKRRAPGAAKRRRRREAAPFKAFPCADTPKQRKGARGSTGWRPVDRRRGLLWQITPKLPPHTANHQGGIRRNLWLGAPSFCPAGRKKNYLIMKV